MDKLKLDRWAEKLLDTGKTNNLIKFRDSKASTVEVIYPDVSSLFSKASDPVSFEVYDPQIEDDEEFISSAEAEEENDSRKMTKEEYYNKFSGRIRKNNQVLLYNHALTPITALRNIDKKAKTALEETGVNLAYMAFGFINWTEKDYSEVVMRAPILLVPVTFERESQISPYYIKTTEDDIIVNPTFSFKLQAEYSIKLPEYNDEDFETYLGLVEEKVKKLGWTVSNECKIAIFSFHKINMYRDLKDNQDAILSNTNIRRLLGEDVDSSYADYSDITKTEGYNPLISLHNVVNADSSQIEAIERAKSGASFVLQGPPGTGKSQTITNIIAECLYDGKKVLFVSEKQAALNVVYDKLKKAGLAEFCLELHSHKANKKTVIEELCRTLRENKKKVSSKAQIEINEKEMHQKCLDKYDNELHKRRDTIDMSLYDMYDEYSSCRNVPDTEISIPDLTKKDVRYLNQVMTLLKQYANNTDSVGYDFRENVWYGFIGKISSFQAESQIKENLRIIVDNLRTILTAADDINDNYGISAHSIENAKCTGELLSLLAETDIITPYFFKKESVDYTVKMTATLKSLAEQIINNRSAIDAEFDDAVYKLDAEEYSKRLKRQYTSRFGRLFDSGYKGLVTEIRLCKMDGRKVSYSDAIRYMDTLENYKHRKEEFSDTEAVIKQAYGPSYAGIDTDWNHIMPQLDKLAQLVNRGIDFGRLGEFDLDTFEQSKNSFKQYADSLNEAVSQLEPVLPKIIELFDRRIVDFWTMTPDEVLRKCSGCYAEVDKISEWTAFQSLLDDIKGQDAYDILIDSIAQVIQPEDVAAFFKRAFYRQWIEDTLRTVPIFASITRAAHDQAVEVFKQKDIEQFEISKAQIKEKLSSKRPSADFVASGSAIEIILREEGKKRRQKSIRNLLVETAEAVQLIKPCFLMSPLSVSTYLASSKLHFDVVVFDEASQIFPQDAVGSIYRADQAIIVGDSKQMPPSNFFNSNVDIDDDDEEIGDITDFDSILDMCKFMKPLSLNWHYRSHYEQLISFSNKNFYDNRLITFPSSKTDCEGIGVDYYHVDGLFDRKSKTNRVEAERVVDLIFEDIEKYPNRSLGIVAFSVSQADLIDKLLSRRRQENTKYEWFFSGTVNEPFFIKNLETVQGDERDTIIFSIAYGMGTDGRLLNNFGPLNREGGERRLNVAVSRARDNVQVVSSMHHTDIDLKGSSSRGAGLLREYLDFAENGTVALQRSIEVKPDEEFDSEFEMEVCDFLRENGYEVDTQVGCSKFRIDLALKKPGTSDYVLAIECDGAGYHSSKNARDRDRLRQEILESMGWRFYRIWSTDWFKNNRVEKQRLLDAVQSALNKPVTNPEAPKKNMSNETVSEDNEFSNTVEKRPIHFPEYKMVDTSLYGSEWLYSKARFYAMITGILMSEAPISEEWLLQRICHCFGRTKVTSVVRDEYERLMIGHENEKIIRKNGFLYRQDTGFVLRVPPKDGVVRDISAIALEELAAGILFIVKQNVKADRLGIYKVITSQLGFARMGGNIEERLDAALGLLKRYVDVDGETITLK